MEKISCFIRSGLPSRHLAGPVRVANVDDPKRAGGVIRQIDIASVNECAVHPTSYRVGEFGDWFGMGRILERQHHDAILPGRGAFPRQYSESAVLRGHDIVDRASIHHHRVGDDGGGWVADIDGVNPVADGAQISVLPVGVQPELRCTEFEWYSPNQSAGPADIPGPHLDCRLGSVSGEAGANPVPPRSLAHEITTGPDISASGIQGPGRHGVLHQAVLPGPGLETQSGPRRPHAPKWFRDGSPPT